jgi:hypothetical protein
MLLLLTLSIGTAFFSDKVQDESFCWVAGFELWVSSCGFRVAGFELWVSSCGFRVVNKE